MINYDLIEGLRIALSKGYTLEQAMMSFYNAGYPKEEIEEAARVLLYRPSQKISHPKKPIPEYLKQPAKSLPVQTSTKKIVSEKNLQKISDYDEKNKGRTKAVISFLILILFILLALLGGVILFKEYLIDLFSNLI